MVEKVNPCIKYIWLFCTGVSHSGSVGAKSICSSLKSSSLNWVTPHSLTTVEKKNTEFKITEMINMMPLVYRETFILVTL